MAVADLAAPLEPAEWAEPAEWVVPEAKALRVMVGRVVVVSLVMRKVALERSWQGLLPLRSLDGDVNGRDDVGVASSCWRYAVPPTRAFLFGREIG